MIEKIKDKFFILFYRPLYFYYQTKLKRSLKDLSKPNHIALLADGNRRWAKSMGNDNIVYGYEKGAEKVVEVLNWSKEVGINHITLYLLSAENLARPKNELDPLLQVILNVVKAVCSKKNNYQVTLIGSTKLLPSDFSEKILSLISQTSMHSGIFVNMAIGYGGRIEIVDAVKVLIQNEISSGTKINNLAGKITEEAISENLYTKGQPDPDLVIRTSGEQRLSGFLTWQSTYSEIWFTEAYWPDFRKLDFLRALRDYGLRHRRFGK